MDQSSKNVASAAFIGAYMLLLVVLRPFQELKIMVRLAPRRFHINVETGALPELGSPLPHLHRDWARPCHICTGNGLGTPLRFTAMVSRMCPACGPFALLSQLHA